ncbi:uncharacterized protein LOC130948371 isoform X1 [Arachis stenosperma]|uniref:uncharacterized protein LOC130948371 isoform X1 n=1 Tax=Arachis stenosperma TaxID=217475 RepID=UPI0025AC5783|nr:uncharacterized protein LOC130948371 isoform X1 [Arachis stenosperma]
MSKMCLDNSAGGSSHMKKTPEKTTKLIEIVANNQYLYSSNRNPINSRTPKKKGILEVKAFDALLAQNKILSHQMNLISQQLSGMQVSAVNTQNAFQETPYDMTGSSMQGIFWLKLRDLSKNLIQRLKRTADAVGF